MDHCRWRKLIKGGLWSGWVWLGEYFFWYRLTRVIWDKGLLNGCCVVNSLRIFCPWCFNVKFISAIITAHASNLHALVGWQSWSLAIASFQHFIMIWWVLQITSIAFIASVMTHESGICVVLTVCLLVMFILQWIRLMSWFLWTQLLNQ